MSPARGARGVHGLSPWSLVVATSGAVAPPPVAVDTRVDAGHSFFGGGAPAPFDGGAET